jgi:fibronectin type 3 domain-containing protein
MFGKKEYYNPGAALLAMLAALLCAACTLGEIPAALENKGNNNNLPGGGLSAPSGVTADGSSSFIEISWNSVPGAYGYKVYRNTTYSGSYSYIGNAYSPFYTDYPSSSGTYYYKVSAVSSYGTESSLSSYATATMSSGTLSAPSGVTASAQSSSSIYITWNSVSGAIYYKVYRAASSSGTYSVVSSNNYDTYYTDSGLNPNTTYYYKVSALNSSWIESSQSNYVSATTSSGSLSAPSGVTATAQSSSSISVSWNSVPGASYYKVYRAASSSGTYSVVASNNYDTYYTDSGRTANTTYYYKVSAVDGSGIEGSQSSYATATTSSGSLSAPSGVTATAQSSSSIYVTWNSVSGASYYKVYRANSSSGTYSVVASNNYDTYYTDSGRTANTTYYYKVSAVNGSGIEGSQSSYTSATTLSGGGGSDTTSPLTSGAWANGSLTSMVTEQWYTFTVNSGSTYYVWLNDSDYSSSSGWMDCQIEVRYNSKTGSIINSGNTDLTSYNFSAAQSGTVYVRVYPYSSGTGAYQVAYSTSSSRPYSY